MHINQTPPIDTVLLILKNSFKIKFLIVKINPRIVHGNIMHSKRAQIFQTGADTEIIAIIHEVYNY